MLCIAEAGWETTDGKVPALKHARAALDSGPGRGMEKAIDNPYLANKQTGAA
jgi:hypothetical protein